ncbi:MAG: NUDIX domain-containing protein [Patescibacteria group bacterium]
MNNSVGILFENGEGKILFLLRDDKPTIPHPNQWDVLGGVVEDGETAEQAIVREMHEELELDLKDFKVFKVFHWPEKIETIFYKKLDLDINKINLHEGQKIKYFSKEELLQMNLAFHDNEIVRQFFL